MIPNPDPAGAKALGRSLSHAGYSEEAIDDLLGEDAWTTALDDAEEHDAQLPDDATGTAIRLFFLELPVARRDAERAFGKRGIAALAATGLAEVGERVEPRSRIAPVDGLLLASDRLSTDPTEDPEDYVSTYSPTARLCDVLTPRPKVKRALDIGTGNGVQALLAARHSSRVVATDVNARALAYTELNAALSGLPNVECRRGSLFEPVADDRFDLIVCNAPYVVSPERRWTYRDGLFEGDGLSERVVRTAGSHLTDGGLATLCVTWLAQDGEEPDARVVSWVEGSGCDAWILASDESEPADYAERWNVHLAADRKAHREAVVLWTSYLERLGARLVVEGIVLLHRRSGENTVRIDEVEEDELEVADAQIRRAFAARALLDGADLLDARLAPADLLRVGARRVVLEEGTRPELKASPRAAELVAALDGQRTLRELGAPKSAVDLCRELVEVGALHLVGFGSEAGRTHRDAPGRRRLAT